MSNTKCKFSEPQMRGYGIEVVLGQSLGFRDEPNHREEGWMLSQADNGDRIRFCWNDEDALDWTLYRFTSAGLVGRLNGSGPLSPRAFEEIAHAFMA